MCVDRGVPVGVWWRRLGPRLERRHALCEPCVSRTGLSPPVCGRQSRVELHIRDIEPRMLPPSAAPGRQVSCTHPCCSFPICSALRAHGTLHSPTPIGPRPPARGCPLFRVSCAAKTTLFYNRLSASEWGKARRPRLREWGTSRRGP